MGVFAASKGELHLGRVSFAGTLTVHVMMLVMVGMNAALRQL
jgi:hypothetical protein